jgi:hypothetical protein
VFPVPVGTTPIVVAPSTPVTEPTTSAPGTLQVTLTAPDSADLDASVNLSVKVAGAPAGESVTLTWDFGDGVSQVLSGTTQPHAWQKAGSYTVVVTAKDGEGDVGSDTKQVDVAAPTFTIGLADTSVTRYLKDVPENGTLSSTPTGLTPDSVTWNWGDGSEGTSSSHSFGAGAFTISADVVLTA